MDSPECCGLRYLRSYAASEGKLEPKPGCTRVSHPTRECRVCPRLFENVLSCGKVSNDPKTWGMRKYRPGKYVEKVFEALKAAGHADMEGVWTTKCMRAGAISAAAAAGCRRKVAAGHMRMQSEATADHYDQVLEMEKGEVSRAINQLVEGSWGHWRRRHEDEA